MYSMRRARGLLTVIVGLLTVIFIVFNVKPLREIGDNQRDERTSEIVLDTRDLSTNVQAHRSVTPSLAELGIRGMLSETNEDVLMLTRVPGAGAELLVLILQRLQGYNAFKHIRLPPGDSGLLTTLQQELLVEEITSIIRQEAIPLSFDGDVRFLNFTQFGRQAPAFISIVRNPLDPRILQRYRSSGGSITYRGSIAHFCGQDPRCTKINNKWRLQRAKETVEKWYRIIGILECMEETLTELERQFPYFFTGANEVYEKLLANAIFGGTIASEGSFKYQVSIWEDHLPICSGAVLDKWRILTAAACVADYPTDYYTVHAGSIIQSKNNSPRYEVEQIHFHPDYNADDVGTETKAILHQSNNLAVLILQQPLPLGEHIASVSLPTEENLPYCSFCQVAGWGLADKVLKWTFQTIYTPNMCLDQDSAHRQNEFCAVDPSEFSNPCDGDDGSPLICDGTAIGIYIPSQIDRGYPVIYAKIFSFLSFINSIQNNISSEAPGLSAVRN